MGRIIGVDKDNYNYRYEDIKKPISSRRLFMFITKLNETMTDKDVIKFFERATGRKYTSNETCINDIRRICLTFWNDELQKRLKKVRS